MKNKCMLSTLGAMRLRLKIFIKFFTKEKRKEKVPNLSKTQKTQKNNPESAKMGVKTIESC